MKQYKLDYTTTLDYDSWPCKSCEYASTELSIELLNDVYADDEAHIKDAVESLKAEIEDAVSQTLSDYIDNCYDHEQKPNHIKVNLFIAERDTDTGSYCIVDDLGEFKA